VTRTGQEGGTAGTPEGQGRKVGWIAASLMLSLPLLAQQPTQSPLQRLEASIQRTTRSVNATWGIYV